MPIQESKSELVYLRALELSDINKVLRWHNDTSLFASLCNPFRYVSRAAEEVWLEKHVNYSDNEVNVAICSKEDDTHIGNIYLRDIDWRAQNAALGLFIGDGQFRGKGCGSSALFMI